MIPFIFKDEIPFDLNDYIFIKDIKDAIINKRSEVKAYVVNNGLKEFTLTIGELTDDERDIIVKGCLINYYKAN